MRNKIAAGVAAAMIFTLACGSEGVVPSPDRRVIAERFFNGVFGCVPGVIDQLAAADVVVSYPIFETVFGTASIQGRDAVKRFSTGFCSRWSDPTITVHQALLDGDRVALIWEFEASESNPDADVDAAGSTRQSWGGISVFTFDADGRVIQEVGEESTPGPVARVR